MGYDKTYSDGYLGMVCDGEKMEYKSQLCAISPDNNGIRDNASVAVTNIRNIKEIKMSVLDADKRKIRTVGIANDIRRKSYLELCEKYFDKLEYLYSTVGDQLIWDGKVYDKLKGEYVKAADGDYFT